MTEEEAKALRPGYHKMVIPLAECKKRHVYRIHSRNLKFGVYDGDGGFIGIREKFGSRYSFTEYHRDTGAPHGTVHPQEDLGPIPEGIELLESVSTGDHSFTTYRLLFEYLETLEDKG